VSDDPAAPAPASILLADDDPSILGTLGFALRAVGYRVEPAVDGTAALAAVERERFDLLVLDVLMPGATGWEVLSHAVEVAPAGAPRPRAILMTGFNQEYVVDLMVLRQEGVSAMLLKPFPASTMLDEVARSLAGPAPRIPVGAKRRSPI
jgi:CheY-like chemotaxis protein